MDAKNITAHHRSDSGVIPLSVWVSVSQCDQCDVSEPALHQSPGTDSPKWNADILNVINSTCAFPALTSQNGHCLKENVIFSQGPLFLLLFSCFVSKDLICWAQLLHKKQTKTKKPRSAQNNRKFKHVQFHKDSLLMKTMWSGQKIVLSAAVPWGEWPLKVTVTTYYC